MRFAVISDIHGNLGAFKQVLVDIHQSRVDVVVCLGDCIGYGPEPEQVFNLIRQENIPSVMGNHELGLVDRSYLDWFNQPTQQSLLQTFKLLSLDTREFMKGLNSSLAVHGCRFVHGFPLDSITTYLFEVSKNELIRVFPVMRERMCFVGHTHVLEIISFDGTEICRSTLRQGLISLPKGQQYIVNVGSVGQPRDGNRDAKYVIWDSSHQTIDVRFIPYDIAATARKILELGFPKMNADRLW